MRCANKYLTKCGFSAFAHEHQHPEDSERRQVEEVEVGSLPGAEVLAGARPHVETWYWQDMQLHGSRRGPSPQNWAWHCRLVTGLGQTPMYENCDRRLENSEQ